MSVFLLKSPICWQEASGSCRKDEHLCSYAENSDSRVPRGNGLQALLCVFGKEWTSAVQRFLSKGMCASCLWTWLSAYHRQSKSPDMKSQAHRCRWACLGQISFASLVGKKCSRCQLARSVETCPQKWQYPWQLLGFYLYSSSSGLFWWSVSIHECSEEISDVLAVLVCGVPLSIIIWLAVSPWMTTHRKLRAKMPLAYGMENFVSVTELKALS